MEDTLCFNCFHCFKRTLYDDNEELTGNLKCVFFREDVSEMVVDECDAYVNEAECNLNSLFLTESFRKLY
jgi:hypothetical protein